jgi:hypothetical protein
MMPSVGVCCEVGSILGSRALSQKALFPRLENTSTPRGGLMRINRVSIIARWMLEKSFGLHFLASNKTRSIRLIEKTKRAAISGTFLKVPSQK